MNSATMVPYAAQIITWMMLLSSTTFRAAHACGGFFCEPQRPILQAGERIIFGVQDSSTEEDMMDITMTVQIAYEGPSEKFGWILPVPVDPTISVSSDILFAQLHDLTSPIFDFTIDTSQSSTCSMASFEFPQCDLASVGGDGESQDDGSRENTGGVIELQRGTVGPFKFSTIMAPEGNPASVFQWLQAEGYDQPPEAEPLVDYYAGMGMVFVALQLQKDKQTGDIQPITMKYSMPSGGPIACVPMQITGIAATDNMPIEIWVLGPKRAVPINYFHAVLDDRAAVDWINCVNRSFPQECYWQSFRSSFTQAMDSASQSQTEGQVGALQGHAFATEFVGPSLQLRNSLRLTIDSAILNQQDTPLKYVQKMREFDIPDARVVQTIVSKYIPSSFTDTAPPVCLTLTDLYSTDANTNTDMCLSFVLYSADPASFDPQAMTTEIEANVIAASVEAEATVAQYDYVTRLFGRQDASQMTRDPFFSFSEVDSDGNSLSGVPRLHKALGVPECMNDQVTSMTMTVGESSDGNPIATYSIPASFSCRVWSSPTFSGNNGGRSSVLELGVVSYNGDEARILYPMLGENGETTFSETELRDAIAIMDMRVPNQTIPNQVIPDCHDCGKNDPSATSTSMFSYFSAGACLLGTYVIMAFQ